MWDFKLLKATQTLEKTMAYMIYRLGMYLVLSLVLIFGIIAGTGTGLILDSMFTTSNLLVRPGGLAGFALFLLFLYWFRGSWFFSMKSPHIALLNESLGETMLPSGWAQVAHARSMVSERFATAAELYTLDRRIKGVLACLFQQSSRIGQRISSLGETMVFRIVARVMDAPANYTHEVVIGNCLADANRTPSAAAIRVLSLYAQNFERLFKNGLVLLLLKYLLAALVFFAMLAPVGWVDELIPVEFGEWRYVFAMLLTWPIKAALFDPIVLAAMLGVFADLTRGQKIDPDIEEKLAQASPEFASIQRQAEFLEKTSVASDDTDDLET